MWGLEPRMRSRSSCWRPVISASAMTSAMTPTVTPSVEMNEMTEMNACFRFASRYRMATCSSNGRSRMNHANAKARNSDNGLSCFRAFVADSAFMDRILIPLTHQGKQDDVADRCTVGQEHHEPIDADA